jgi:peptidoglycan/LPS O-acetylase OafA/YrhL
VPALDGLRGIAIALVVGYHYFGIPPGGSVGVDLFFVLSGFLITTLLLEQRASRGVSLRAFYVRRARRLFPALVVVVAAYLLLAAAKGENQVAVAAIGVSYAANAVLAYGVTPIVSHSALSPLWSLAEEEQFYLLWPGLLLLLARSRRIFAWIALMTISLALYRAGLDLAGHSYTRIYYGPDTHADGLLAGALLAVLRFRSGLRVGEWAGTAGTVVLAASAVLSWLVIGWAVWGVPMFEAGAVCLIAAAVSDTELARALSSPRLVWLGKRSYSLYLWHLVVLRFVYPRVLHPFVLDLTLRLAALALAVVLAAVSYRYVELPFRPRRKLELQPVTGSRDSSPDRSAAEPDVGQTRDHPFGAPETGRVGHPSLVGGTQALSSADGQASSGPSGSGRRFERIEGGPACPPRT